MMQVAGVDVGAGTAKAVIMSDSNITSCSVKRISNNVVKAAEEVTNEALDKAGLSLSNLDYVVATGWGRNAVSFANKTSSEIICHASGVYFLIPQVRTIIDIGAQDSKVTRVNEKGEVVDFIMNDKCAAGTGRFLEVMAQVLGITLEEMGPLSLTSENPCSISSTCTVFAETEVISLRAEGKHMNDLIAGIHKAIASRIIVMGSGIGFDNETVFTGGVAKNSGVKEALEEAGQVKITVPKEPQITGALGAALIAQVELTQAASV